MTQYKKNGKILGVVGGLGPAASAEFLRQLAKRCPATCDQDHPVVYMLADCDIPDRGTAILGKGPSPLPKLKEDIQKLVDMGADVIAVPCNTAHYFINEFVDEIPVQFLHIVEETVKRAQKRSPEGAWMLSTKGTRACGLYQKVAEKYNYKLYIPSESQSDRAQQVIDHVKAGKIFEAGCIMNDLVEELWTEHDILIMTACTELPLGYDASGLPQERNVSSINALVAACVEALDEPMQNS